MAYTNSPLVSYTQISPNRTINRSHAIDTITIHCVAGQSSVEGLGSVFAAESRQASANYGIGADGRIGMYCEEKDRSWCSSNRDNDHRAVTIEVASEDQPPYAVGEAAYRALIDLITDVCRRNGIPRLLWKADKTLLGKTDQQNMTVHRWFSNTDCPGEYLFSRYGAIADEVNRRLSGASVPPPAPSGSVNPPAGGFLPYRVKVDSDHLIIRKGPGTDSPRTGKYTGKGVFTIVDEAAGKGASRWGKLKSGAGWIALDYAKRI